jgi:hypothetical protein
MEGGGSLKKGWPQKGCLIVLLFKNQINNQTLLSTDFKFKTSSTFHPPPPYLVFCIRDIPTDLFKNTIFYSQFSMGLLIMFSYFVSL